MFIEITSKTHRYGFNGKELDTEGMGGGLSTYDYGFRIYNPSFGRFLSVDPLFSKFAMLTPYQFASNTPIWAIDVDGLEAYVATNKAADVMTVEDWQNFSQKEALNLINADNIEELQVDCADAPVILLARYFKSKGVELVISFNGITRSSSDSKYKGEDAFDKFVEDIRLNLGSRQLRDSELVTEIEKNEIAPGDMHNAWGHVQVYLKTNDDGTIEMLNASGHYMGKNHPETLVPSTPTLETYNNLWGAVFRWNFLSTIPMRNRSEIPEMLKSRGSEQRLETRKNADIVRKNTGLPTPEQPKSRRRGKRE